MAPVSDDTNPRIPRIVAPNDNIEGDETTARGVRPVDSWTTDTVDPTLLRSASPSAATPCPRCARSVAPTSRFCIGCGAEVHAGLSSTDGVAPTVPATGGSSRQALKVVAGVLAVAVLGTSAFFATRMLWPGGSTDAAAAGSVEQPSRLDPQESPDPSDDTGTEQTPEQSPETDSQPVDPLEQLASHSAAGASVLATIPAGTWVPQVSSKCASLETMDYSDEMGRAGWPDGVLETVRGGIGNTGVLAFHEGLGVRLGYDGIDYVLVTPRDLGQSSQNAGLCGTEQVWISLITAEQYPTSDGALAVCDGLGLPFGECAARRIGPNTTTVFPKGDPPAPDSPNTYPVLVDSFLVVRSEPSVDAREVGRVSAGGFVTIECTTQGDPIEDPDGNVITRWDFISAPFEGYVADAFVDTGGVAPPVPRC